VYNPFFSAKCYTIARYGQTKIILIWDYANQNLFQP
jgi:hypothetical protein